MPRLPDASGLQPPVQDQRRRLTRILVLGKPSACDHSDEGLAHHLFMTAKDSVRGVSPPAVAANFICWRARASSEIFCMATVSLLEGCLAADCLRNERLFCGVGFRHGDITVPEDRFAEAKAWLQERVPLLNRDGMDEFALGAPWNSQSVYFAGTDGIPVELIARHDLSAASRASRRPEMLRSVRSALPCRMWRRRSRVCGTRSACRCSASLRQSSLRCAIPTGS